MVHLLVESPDQCPEVVVREPSDQWFGHICWMLVPPKILDRIIVPQLSLALLERNEISKLLPEADNLESTYVLVVGMCKRMAIRGMGSG